MLSGLLAIGALVAVAGISATSSVASVNRAASQSSKKFTIYVSNSFIGNTWRIQMENQIKALAAQPRYASHVSLNILNSSANTVGAQTADLLTAIRAHPSAILIDAASATALNPTIQRACQSGILVVSFDQTVTAPCAQKLAQNFVQEATDGGAWLAAKLHDKGDILVDTGIPGGPASDTMTHYWTKVFPKKYPNIHIVSTYQSQVSPGTELQQLSGLLSAHRSVVGVLSEGYCSSIQQAFSQAGLKAPAADCLNTNVNAIACQKDKMACYLHSNPSWVGALAFTHAMNELMHGAKYPKLDYIESLTHASVSTAGKVAFRHINPVDPLKKNVNYFPSLSPDLVLTVTGAGLNLTATNALKGP